jgi:very-short-patch-repair endonuclease
MLWALAAAFNQYRFERAAEDAWHRQLITPTAAAAYLEAHRCRGKDGVKRLETWLDSALGRNRASQSDLERTLLEAIDRCGLPEPIRQHPLTLPGGETIHFDIAWPDIRLAVEPGDSWWHGGDLGQRRDQARDRTCLEAGWQVVRFDESMRANPDAAAAQVRRIHRRRSTEPALRPGS